MPTALITGGARRIGAAIAADLFTHGYHVCIQYSSSKTEADELVSSLTSSDTHANAIIMEADLLSPDNCISLFRNAREQLGRIDVLINNASIFEPDEASTFNEETWHRHLAIHMTAPSVLAAEMAAQNDLTDGLIVNMIDQRVLRPNPKFYSYTLSKSALWTATQIMAQTFAPNIRVNAIGPGPTLANSRQSTDDFEKQANHVLLKKPTDLADFGATIRYLQTTQSITGQMILLDGGQHLAWETPDVAGITE